MVQQKGWIYVLIGLLLSSFLGGAINVFFSPDRLREFVDKTLLEKQPKFELKFSQVELKLSSNGWPAIAIQINDVELNPKDPCVTNSYLQMNWLVVPIRISTLFKKKIRFSHVEAGNVRFHYRAASCASARAEIETKPTEDFDFTRMERFFQKRWAREVVNTTRFLDRFTVERLEITRDDQSLPPLLFNDFEVIFHPEKREVDILTEVVLQSPLMGRAPPAHLDVQATVRASEFQLQSQGHLKEGQLSAAFRWAIDRGEFELKTGLRDVPLQSLFQIAQNYGLLAQLAPDLKNQWAVCDFTMSGQIRDYRRLAAQLHQCRLYGDLGNIKILSREVSALDPFRIKMSLQDSSIKRWLKAFGWEKSWGRISEFGLFRGEMQLAGKNNIEINGDVSDMEIYLASFDHRVRQKLDNFQLSLAIVDERFSGQAQKFQLPDGEVDGSISFNVSLEGTGLLRLAFSKIGLGVDSQKAIWNGRVPELALVGQAQLAQGSWTEFVGEIGMAEWVTLPWELRGIKAKLQRNATADWTAQATADKWSLRPESYWQPSFDQMLSNAATPPAERTVTGLSGQFDFLIDGSVAWRNLQGKIKTLDASLLTSGQWMTKTGLSGAVEVKNRSTQQSWRIAGDWSRPQLIKNAD